MIIITSHKNNLKFCLYLVLIFLTISLFSTFVQASSSCFLPGTLITMGNGAQVPIEKIKAGDKIISYDENLKPVVTDVIETESPMREDYYIITFENRKELKITNEHPLYIKSGKYEGWGSIIPEATKEDANIKTKKISVGDSVLNIEKKWIRITSIKHVKEKVQTYNLKKVNNTNTFFAEGFLAHNKGGGSKGCTPTQPTPCRTKSGCYDRSDNRIDFGSVAPGEFGSFYGIDACITESVSTGCGGTAPCNCLSGVYVDEAKETSPDSSSGACNCIAGTDWNAKAKCCGKDSSDCGKVSSGVLCSVDSNGQSAIWIPSTANLGDIRFVGCTGAEFLSDGSTWRKCDGTFWKQTIGNSEYVCIGKGRESIAECCGDGTCKSKIDGKRLSTGQSVNPEKFGNDVNQVTGNAAAATDSKTYYCRPDRKFVTDLDISSSQANDKTLIANDRPTCEKAGLTWTGTKCCSEDDDPNEYYNDPKGKGGCWDKKYIESISFVDGTADSVVNYNGEFHGCAIDKSNFNKDNDALLNIIDKHAGNPLVTNHPYCFNDPNNNYFCSYTEKWLPTEGADRTHVSFAPVSNANRTADCCAKDECWDGQECIANQRDEPLAQPLNGARCIDGEWTESLLRSTPDDTSSAFCPKRTQCLTNPSGISESSQCVDTNEYVEDNYCENGTWSSRTKLLALKLLKLKSGDYTLFCDSRENTLNNLQYLTGSGEVVSNVLTNIQTNNFCILNSGGKIIAATSINRNPEDLPSSSLDILGITSCSDALIDDGNYHPCDVSNKVWFNKRLKSFIYSSTAIQNPSDEESSSFISNLIKSIIDAVKGVFNPPDHSIFEKGLKKFDRLYSTQQGSKSIKGSIEGRNVRNAIIQYTGFDTDICKFVEQFSQANKQKSPGDLSFISCNKDGSAYYVLAQGNQFSNLDPDSIWPDLTSKLRISDSAFSAPAESCFDNIKNQNEIGIDCGEICKACISDKNSCQNAQDGDLCGGLDIAFSSGFKNACCKEFKLCC